MVVSDKDLADEGRLIAGELGMKYAGEKDDAKAGDVRLALNDDKGATATTQLALAIEDTPDLRTNRALAYERLGRLVEARIDHQEARRLAGVGQP